ncbi:hypothetical protein HRbin30_00542 [bacterium HR30]|nr:hypothetical protein HRbin30_00542 [bacterium HR30]
METPLASWSEFRSEFRSVSLWRSPSEFPSVLPSPWPFPSGLGFPSPSASVLPFLYLWVSPLRFPLAVLSLSATATSSRWL